MAGDGDGERDQTTKEAIEGKIQSRDYVLARELIRKAPDTLEHASEMLTVCDILCSAEIELPGCGVDWYFVLQIFPSDEPGVIRAQYHKLLSQLVPIKDCFSGTRLALDFISEAFSVLSDPAKRADFDARRNNMSNLSDGPDVKVHSGSGIVNSGEATSTERAKRAADEACKTTSGHTGPSNEVVADENKKRKIFDQEATWVASPARFEEAAGIQATMEAADGNRSCSMRARPEPEFFDFDTNRRMELFSVGQVWVIYDEENMPRRYAQIVGVVPDKFELYVSWFKPCPISLKERRWFDAGMPVACGKYSVELNRVTLCGRWMFSHLLSDDKSKHPFEIYPNKGDVWAIYRDWDIGWSSEPDIRKKCGYGMVEILTDYSKDLGVKVAYLVKVDGFQNIFQRYSKRGDDLSFHVPVTKLLMFSHNIPAFRFLGGEMSGIRNGMLELDPFAVPDNLVNDFSRANLALEDTCLQLHEELNCSDEASFTQVSNPSINVMDTGGSNPQIQNRKSNWSPKDFAAEQVWAVYDGADAMPRLYVKVTRVLSITEVCVTFLEPHPMIDEEIQWMEDNMPIVCGIFRSGKETSILDMSRFSHIVKCDRSSKKSFYRIFPQKGEVWAIYKNWSINWKSSNLVRYQCRIVEILSDLSEETGISICSLTEVSGCFTFFERQLHEGFQLTRQVSRLEMLSFSHQIPAFLVTGIKDRGIPKGSWHLEPDALPPKFGI